MRSECAFYKNLKESIPLLYETFLEKYWGDAKCTAVRNVDGKIPFDLPNNWAWCRGYSCCSGMESTKPQGEFFDYIDIDAIDNLRHCIKEA